MASGRGVVVVGAGLSGLTAAHRIARAGIDVTVLEARGRVGGRAWRAEIADGVEFDLGCEAVDAAHHALLDLAAEAGVRTHEVDRWAGGEPEDDAVGAGLLSALGDEIAGLVARIDPEHPEDTEDAHALDGQTLGGWLRARGGTADVVAAAEMHYAVASSTVPVDRMSLLAYAAKLAAGADRTGLSVRLDGGPSALAARLAEGLDVRRTTAVSALEQDDTSIRVVAADGSTFTGSRVVVAIPLTTQRAVRFSPPLPAWRRRALATARYGDAVKAGLLYDQLPEGFRPAVTPGGVVYRADSAAPVAACFVGSGPARRLAELDTDERHAELARLVEAKPRAIRSAVWAAEEWSRGSYLILGPGELLAWGRRLGEPHGRIHFAGSEASVLPSYMNGAVLAGERAAREILEG